MIRFNLCCFLSGKKNVQFHLSRKNYRKFHSSGKRSWIGPAGLCSKNGVLCFRASPMKLRYYAQNYAQLEVLCFGLQYTKMHWARYQVQVPKRFPLLSTLYRSRASCWQNLHTPLTVFRNRGTMLQKILVLCQYYA